MKGDYEVGERCTSYLINIFIACNCNGSCKMNNKSFAKEKKIKFDYFTFCKKEKKRDGRAKHTITSRFYNRICESQA